MSRPPASVLQTTPTASGVPSPQVSSSPSSQAAADAGLQQQIADSSQNAVSQPPATQAAADAGLQQQIADSSESVLSQPPAITGNSNMAMSPSGAQNLQDPFGDAAASQGGAMPQKYQPAQPPQALLNSTSAAGPSERAAASQAGAQVQIPSSSRAAQGIINTTDAASPSWATPASQGGNQVSTQQPDQAALVDPGTPVAAPAALQAQTPAQQQPLTAQSKAPSTTAATAAGPSQSTAVFPKQDVTAMSSMQPPAADKAYGNPQPYIKEYQETEGHWRKLAIAGMHAVCTIDYTCSSDCTTLPTECRKGCPLKRLTVLDIASGGAYAYRGDL